MALTLQEFKSYVWNCAEILRGSAVDRTDWKAYILPLLFFKRICDVWDEERVEAVELYGDVDPVDYPEIHRGGHVLKTCAQPGCASRLVIGQVAQ
jgi:type I restriction enzyme M protein